MVMLAAGSAMAQNYNVDFEDSMNNELLELINSERAKHDLPALTYHIEMQKTADQLAEKLKVKLCHCYGGAYVTENLYAAPSTKAVIKDLASMGAKNNPLKMKGIKSVVIGISDDENYYYYSIRTF